MLRINDVFWTFQGEGTHAGRRALFVRMPFCNLSCSWCDTEFNSFEKWDEEKFIKFAAMEKCDFAVITGGEPTMNKQTPLIIDILKSLNFTIAVESNGNFPNVEGFDFITVSPKRDADYDIHPDIFHKVNDYKYVIDEGFQWDVLKRHNTSQNTPNLFLSPEYGRFEKSLQEIYEYIKENPQWRISLQTHKWMNIP